MTPPMVTGPKRIWVLAVSGFVLAAGFAAVAAAGGADEAPVEAAAPAAAAEAGRPDEVPTADAADRRVEDTADQGSDGPTTTATTATTAPPTTTTAPPAPAAQPARDTPAPAPAPAPAPPATAAPAPPPPPPPPPPPAPSGPAHGTRNGACEAFMAEQVNAARARAGRPALAFDGGIQYIAVGWSDTMAGRQVLSHNPDYADQILRHRDYRTAGENVGRGHDLGSLFQAFMDSPAHRANIEEARYSHITVGCLTDGSGQYWVTQNFWG